MKITQHRYHAANNLEPSARIEENSNNLYNYRHTDYIDNPCQSIPGH